jgi:hypothetical protein
MVYRAVHPQKPHHIGANAQLSLAVPVYTTKACTYMLVVW